MFSRSLLCVSLLLALTVSAHAQIRRPPREGKQPKTEQFEGEGTIENIRGNMFEMSTATNQRMLVAIPPGAKVRYAGTATTDFLRPGMHVEFTAEVQKNGVVKDKVTQLTIFSPSQEMPIGLFPEGTVGGKGKDKDEDPLGGKLGGDGADNPAKAPKAKGGRKGKQGFDDVLGGLDSGVKGRKGPAPAVQLPANCTVRGKITKCSGTNLTVQYRPGSVTLELDDTAQITVDMADCSLAVKGDKVSVKGTSMEKRVLADMVKVESAQALTGGKKRPARPDRTFKTEKPIGKASEKPKKGGDDLDLPELKE